ncbi:DgyrCDS7124 [Dimorphilus gyrociliatus]|uniref:DgyrCDS7124 n=1 Tax=Dimorphilus gyrociliatus TaxID=2664684 RepID=A0A7I8VQA9_9ANNE|nr:DgyrCDS7124 [Dimorphilus gyrociliatus]
MQRLSCNDKQIKSKQQRIRKATMQWLENNYEIQTGSCLARSTIYKHYLFFCKQKSVIPFCAATLGKIVRMKFPELSTRRLGTRGHSKYHYFGLAIRPNSIHYRPNSTECEGVTRFSNPTHVYSENQEYSLQNHSGISAPNLCFGFNRQLSVATASFLSSYQQHQQRLLNLLTKHENIDKIFQEIHYFWKTISMRTDKSNRCIVLQCDVLFYKLLSEILIPSDLPVLKDSLVDYVKTFLFNWPIFIERSMTGDIKDDRLNLARRFCSKVHRHLVFASFVQKSRSILFDGDQVRNVLNDLENAISCLTKEYHFLESSYTVLSIKVLDEFADTIRKTATIQGFIDCVDAILVQNVMIIHHTDQLELGKQLALEWNWIGEILTLWNMCSEYLRLALLEHKENLEDYQLQESLENHLQVQFDSKHQNYGNISNQYNYYN